MSIADLSVDGACSHRQECDVGIADYAVTTTGAVLTTTGLGSCLGICLFDRTAGVAGLIHVKLPTADSNVDGDRPTFVDSGIDLLVEEMERQGAVRDRLTAKIAGGSDMFGFSDVTSGIGNRNIERAKEHLAARSISLVAEDTGGDHSRRLQFDGHTGELVVESTTDQTADRSHQTTTYTAPSTPP